MGLHVIWRVTILCMRTSFPNVARALHTHLCVVHVQHSLCVFTCTHMSLDEPTTWNLHHRPVSAMPQCPIPSSRGHSGGSIKSKALDVNCTATDAPPHHPMCIASATAGSDPPHPPVVASDSVGPNSRVLFAHFVLTSCERRSVAKSRSSSKEIVRLNILDWHIPCHFTGPHHTLVM